MSNYKGRRRGTRRVVIWAQGRSHEWIVAGTKADGDAFEARKRVELEAGTLTKRAAPTFYEFCERQYRPFAEANLKASTWGKVRTYQLATLVEFFGQKKLTEITTEDVESFKRVRARSVLPSSVNNELRVMGTVLRWAARTGFPVTLPELIKLPRRGQSRVRVWTLEDLGRLFDAARILSPGLMALLVYLANTGCRKGEAIAAEWDWMDFSAGMIRIPSNEYWQPKNGKPREVPMSDAVRALLAGPRRHERWVFPSRYGGRYADFPKDLYWSARRAAKLQGGPHTLRHTFASHFLQAVPDLFLLAQVLGHSSTRVTELYSHLLPGHLSRARNAVNVSPKLQTMAETMAAPEAKRVSPKKIAKRH
jgi:integrase